MEMLKWTIGVICLSDKDQKEGTACLEESCIKEV
jgi:hypothetical protein